MRHFVRSLNSLVRWARLADRMGSMKSGEVLTSRTLADDTGDTVEGMTALLTLWEGLGWVTVQQGAFGYRHWRPTEQLPPVEPDEVIGPSTLSHLMSAAITLSRAIEVEGMQEGLTIFGRSKAA